MRDYRNGVPLQPSAQWLIRPVLESVYVFGQQEAVHQTLDNTTPFTLLPLSYTRSRWKGFAVQLEWGPPFQHDSGDRRHVYPDLSRWLPDNDTPWWSGGSPSGCITWAGKGLFGHTWSLLSAAGRRRRRRGSLISTLRFLLLRDWPSSRHETADCHCPSCHHVVTLIGFGFWRANWFNGCFLGFLNRGFWFNKSLGFYKGLGLNGGFKLNRHVCLFPVVLRHTFSRLVP